MTTTFVFRNKGEIDPRSISTFGVSSKDNPNAIGFFGTGLKYAIAILLRTGCTISIWSGMNCYSFGVKRDRVRNDDFDIVTMNGEPLGFTTEMGKTWEMWQCFRELWCNCADEKGESFEVADPSMIDPEPDTTTIIVTGEPFHDVWAKRSEIVLDTPAIVKTEAAHIHRGSSQYIFYRGIRALKLETPSAYTYNIQRKMDLTEDRTIKYGFLASSAVANAICATQDRRIIRNVVTAEKGAAEHEMNFTGHTCSEEFLDEVKKLMKAHSARLNHSAREAARVWIMDQLHEEDALRPLSAQDQERLNRAIQFCRSLGYPVDEYPIIVSEWLGENVLGRAEDGKIYLSRRAFMMGTKMVAGTILEEFLHLRHNLPDESRSMQNFLIDVIMSMGEEITKETL